VTNVTPGDRAVNPLTGLEVTEFREFPILTVTAAAAAWFCFWRVSGRHMS